MTEVTVRYFGILREIVGKRQERVELPGSSTLFDLVKMLSESHGQKFSNFVMDSKGKTRNGIAFATDGDSIDVSKLSKTKCASVKEFAILPPISGGNSSHEY